MAASVYDPAANNERVVFINSAMAVKRRFYHKAAIFLAQQGFSVFTYQSLWAESVNWLLQQ